MIKEFGLIKFNSEEEIIKIQLSSHIQDIVSRLFENSKQIELIRETICIFKRVCSYSKV